MSKVVKSPGGDSVEIVNDDDWLQLTGLDAPSLRTWSGASGGKSQVIRALWEHGTFTDASGRAGIKLMEAAGNAYGSPAAMSTLFRQPVNAPAFERETRGKRTYSIRLVALPETWYNKLQIDIQFPPHSNGDVAEAEVPQEAPVDAQEAPTAVEAPVDAQEAPEAPVDALGLSDAEWQDLKLDAPTLYEPTAPAIEIELASQVAMSLLTTVVEIISAGTADTAKLMASKRMADDLAQTQRLLSQRLDENAKLRRQIREAADHINALKVERDGLRSRLQSTEYNLTQVLKGESAQVVNSEIHKRIDQIMRTTPTQKGG